MDMYFCYCPCKVQSEMNFKHSELYLHFVDELVGEVKMEIYPCRLLRLSFSCSLQLVDSSSRSDTRIDYASSNTIMLDKELPRY
ncbi:hypothetical protein SDJN02_23968, partial [Cucurbita argyrosperma subsp. argyrosperma]